MGLAGGGSPGRDRCARHSEGEEWWDLGCQAAKVVVGEQEREAVRMMPPQPHGRGGDPDMSRAHPLVPAGKGGTGESPAWELGARPHKQPLGLEVGVWGNTWDLTFRPVSPVPAPPPAPPPALAPAPGAGCSQRPGPRLLPGPPRPLGANAGSVTLISYSFNLTSHSVSIKLKACFLIDVTIALVIKKQ